MMYPTRSREAALPIQRTELGFVQHTLYRQPDLYHEAVIELDSPFAAIFAADTAVFSFLVLGDQNAGKSTFLHAFSYDEDANFIQLTSHFPILTSTRAPRDELPFLDTDIARGTFLLSLEDFYFFLNEHDLPLEPVPETTRFALIQFIEIGGDHLDLMMHPELSTSPQIAEIAQRSRELLRETRKTIYFANCSTLFASVGSEPPVLARLAYLNCQVQPNHELLFYLSRPPAAINVRASCEVAGKALGLDSAAVNGLFEVSASGLLAFVRALLALLSKRHSWSIVIGGCYEARHLLPEQSLNIDALVEMVAQLFRHHMMDGERGTKPLVAAHLLRTHRAIRERVNVETGELNFWITPSIFGEYLESMHGSEVPESLLLQQFPSVAHALAAGGLCISHAANNFSNLIFSFEFDSVALATWYPAGLTLQAAPAAAKLSVFIPTMKSAPRLATEAQVRFPIYSALYDVIAFYFTNNVPPSFWLADENSMRALHVTGAVAARLTDVLRHLTEEELPRQWNKLLSAPRSRRLSTARVFVWLFEEWYLGVHLLRESGSSVQFPLKLPISGVFVSDCLSTLFPTGPPPPIDSRPSVCIPLQRLPSSQG